MATENDFQFAAEAFSRCAALFSYNPEEARDQTGKWTGGGGAPKSRAKPMGKGPREPWQHTRKEFNQKYYQHNFLREGVDPKAVIEGIKQQGFQAGIGPNVVMPTTGEPRDIMQTRYGTRAGRPVIAVPASHVRHTPNGPKIKNDWRFEYGAHVTPAHDFEPLHRAVVREALAAGHPVPPEVLADYPDLVDNRPTAGGGLPGQAP